jgi:hypothetical protein
MPHGGVVSGDLTQESKSAAMVASARESARVVAFWIGGASWLFFEGGRKPNGRPLPRRENKRAWPCVRRLGLGDEVGSLAGR